MEKSGIVPDPRRWLVLAAYMAVTLACEIQWLAHAAIARAAEAFYAGQFDPESIINIDSLALLYMLVYLVLSIPASKLIDSKGIRIGVGFGAVLLVLGSLGKAIFARNFSAQLVAQLALAASQPFIINATTALSARWFPLRERGLAAGLASLAQYLGFVVALGVTPLMVVVNPASANYGGGIDRALVIYGAFALVAGIAALLFIRENPAARRGTRDGGFQKIMGIRETFAKRDMKITFLLFLIGLGVMNALTSMTDSVAGAIGAKDSDGLIGVFMIFGGVIGAVVMPALSDKKRMRKPFIVICAALMIPGTAGLAFVKQLNPYAYSWHLSQEPGGTGLTIREDIPHPMFRSSVPGRYNFDFILAAKKDGDILERRTLTVAVAEKGETAENVDHVVAPGQTLLLDGTPRDDDVIATIYAAALVAAFIFGFAVMSAGPLGFQYAAEVSHPAPEATSQGVLLLAGQISGMIFTAGMSMRKNLYLNGFLILFAALMIVMLGLALLLGESPLIVTEAEKYREDESIS